MIDREKFFPLVRSSVFNGSMTQQQVDGINAILDEGDGRGTPLPYIAYFLATPMIETGGRFEPLTESLNYSVSALKSKFGRARISLADAEKYGRSGGRKANEEEIGNRIYGGDFGKDQLGNVEPGDGFRFRGRGLAQLTGRRNYTRAGSLAGVNLVRFPERAVELRMSVIIMFDAMLSGWFTGKKLSDYLDGSTPDFVNARRTINGTDRAADIAAFAVKFLDALKASTVAGRVSPAPTPVPRPSEPVPAPPDVEPAPEQGKAPTGLAAFFAWLFGLFAGKK